MMYLSKGILPWAASVGEVSVSHCGALHKLTGVQSGLWIAGQHSLGNTQGAEQDAALKTIAALGIVECCDDTDDAAVFRMLTNCSICPARVKRPCRLLNRSERRLWKWIAGAGLHLTMAELVLLAERGIKPSPRLLGTENRQTLTEEIYSADTIYDGILEALMEKSPARDQIVRSILGLLRKKQIYLI